MEKLLKALNEYDGEDEGSETKWTDKHFGGLLELKIISKKFGFIKWLVENDKLSFIEGDFKGRHFKGDDYEDLLMLLSIHDNPIHLLNSFIAE